MKKYNYVYITTNVITKKQYIGDHSTNDLNDGYLGSGRPYLKRSIKKYGKQHFKKEILEFFDTKEEAFDAQEKYINEYNTLNPNGYNISPKGGNGVMGCHSDESIEKMKKSLSNLSDDVKKKYGNSQRGKKRGPFSIEHRKKIGDSNRGKKWSNDQKNKNKNFYKGKNNGMFGKNHSLESRKKMSLSHIGKSNGPLSFEHKSKISKSLYGDKNPMNGKKLSDETKRKIKESIKKTLEKKRQ